METRKDFWGRRRQFLGFVIGVLMPISAFFGSINGMLWGQGLPWQSGLFWTKAHLMLSWPSVWPFLPLLFVSILSYSVWCFFPNLVRRYFVWRLGVYGGTVFAIQMLFLLYPVTSFAVLLNVLPMMFIGSVAILMVVVAPAMLVFATFEKYAYIIAVAIAVMFLASFQVFVYLGYDRVSTPLEFLISITGAASPLFVVLVYFRASMNLWKGNSQLNRFSIFNMMCVTAWVSANIASWKMSIELMVFEYNKLPAEDPNCYVSSAAANGHRNWVRRFTNDEDRIGINRQMQFLKVGELMLRQVAPSVHRVLRSIYNFVGPVLARWVNGNVWLADVSYLFFVPAEWVVRLLVDLVGIDRPSIERIYLVDNESREQRND